MQDKREWSKLREGFFAGIRRSLQRLLRPVCCTCCERSYNKSDTLSHYIDSQVTHELKIVRWIVLMRSAEIGLQRLMPPDEWQDIVNESLYRYVKLNPTDKAP